MHLVLEWPGFRIHHIRQLCNSIQRQRNSRGQGAKEVEPKEIGTSSIEFLPIQGQIAFRLIVRFLHARFSSVFLLDRIRRRCLNAGEMLVSQDVVDSILSSTSSGYVSADCAFKAPLASGATAAGGPPATGSLAGGPMGLQHLQFVDLTVINNIGFCHGIIVVSSVRDGLIVDFFFLL